MTVAPMLLGGVRAKYVPDPHRVSLSRRPDDYVTEVWGVVSESGEVYSTATVRWSSLPPSRGIDDDHYRRFSFLWAAPAARGQGHPSMLLGAVVGAHPEVVEFHALSGGNDALLSGLGFTQVSRDGATFWVYAP